MTTPARITRGPFAGHRARILDELEVGPRKVKLYRVEVMLTPTKKASARTHLMHLPGSHVQRDGEDPGATAPAWDREQQTTQPETER